MASNLTDSFDVLMDEDEWLEAGAVFVGFMAPTVARNVLEGSLPFDAPDETYGVAVMVGGQYAPMYSNQISLGGGVYVADKLAERADLKQRVTSIGGGSE